MKNDMLARAGRLATLGRRAFGVREEDFPAYLADIEVHARRAWETYGMLVIPGAEVTQNRLRGRKNSHIIALDIKKYISADTSTRGRRSCAARRIGRQSSRRCAPTLISPSPCSGRNRGRPDGPMNRCRCRFAARRRES